MGKKGGLVYAVILNYNTSSDCAKCITYLKRQTYEDFHIVVVDNGSTAKDEITKLNEICKEQNVKLLINDENKGFSAGNNIGLRYTVDQNADWALIINPDVEIKDTTYIESIMKEIPNWPEAVVVGSDVILPHGEHQNPMVEGTLWDEIFWIKGLFKRIWKKYILKTKNISSLAVENAVTGYCEKLAGCCFFVKTEFLVEIGFLDENVFMYCEEPILAKTVEKYGKRELFIKDLLAYHMHFSATKPEARKTRMEQFYRSREYYLEKYSGFGNIGKKVAIMSRRFEAWLWKHK